MERKHRVAVTRTLRKMVLPSTWGVYSNTSMRTPRPFSKAPLQSRGHGPRSERPSPGCYCHGPIAHAPSAGLPSILHLVQTEIWLHRSDCTRSKARVGPPILANRRPLPAASPWPDGAADFIETTRCPPRFWFIVERLMDEFRKALRTLIDSTWCVRNVRGLRPDHRELGGGNASAG